jgi:hypothetical protein
VVVRGATVASRGVYLCVSRLAVESRHGCLEARVWPNEEMPLKMRCDAVVGGGRL